MFKGALSTTKGHTGWLDRGTDKGGIHDMSQQSAMQAALRGLKTKHKSEGNVLENKHPFHSCVNNIVQKETFFQRELFSFIKTQAVPSYSVS